MMRGREREVERKKNNEKILNAQNRDRKFNKKQNEKRNGNHIKRYKNVKNNIATSSRTFFFVDRSLFVYGRHRIRLGCLDCTH